MDFSPSVPFYQFKKNSDIYVIFSMCMYFFMGSYALVLIPLWLGAGGFKDMSLENRILLTGVFLFFIVVFNFIKEFVFKRNKIVIDESGFKVLVKNEERMRILKNDVWFFAIYPAQMGIVDISFEGGNPSFLETTFASLASILKRDTPLGIAVKARSANMKPRLSPPVDLLGELSYYYYSLRAKFDSVYEAKVESLKAVTQPNFIYFELREGMFEWLTAYYPDHPVNLYRKSATKG